MFGKNGKGWRGCLATNVKDGRVVWQERSKMARMIKDGKVVWQERARMARMFGKNGQGW